MCRLLDNTEGKSFDRRVERGRVLMQGANRPGAFLRSVGYYAVLREALLRPERRRLPCVCSPVTLLVVAVDRGRRVDGRCEPMWRGAVVVSETAVREAGDVCEP